uniref:NADH-ubiquinone oxidoreductase chain 4L n=1 Tax=Physomerus sp. TaxID=2931302 RepID=A0A8T9ZXV7_9HEMI|nr:NADH dehydrogenase subunit 4L [Physomerus sp.]
MINFIIIFMFFMGLISFSLAHKHLLITLFSIEFLVLVIFLSLFLVLFSFGYELFFILIFLSFSVCEGALGLGVLVNMIRSHGNDLLSSLSTLSW